MNLTQIIWYSVGIGFLSIIFILLFSYIIFKLKKEEPRLNIKTSRSAFLINQNNFEERTKQPKIIYVKKHSELKEERKKSKEILIQKRERTYKKLTFHSRPQTKQMLSNDRFTIVNDRLRFAKESYYYIPEYQRKSFKGTMY